VSREQASAHGRSDDGFTLLELLVAVTLLALIAVLLVAGLRTSRSALVRVEQQSMVASVDSVQHLLRRLLAEAHPIAQNSQLRDERDFVGGQDSALFVSGFAPQGQLQGLYRIELVRERGAAPNSGRLLLRQTLHRNPARSAPRATAPSAITTVLLADVGDLRLSYFGRDNREAEPSWRNAWAAVGMPELVGIEVAFGLRDPRRWPKLVIALPKRR
jgi:general secretion pathway protein J